MSRVRRSDHAGQGRPAAGQFPAIDDFSALKDGPYIVPEDSVRAIECTYGLTRTETLLVMTELLGSARTRAAVRSWKPSH